MAEILIVDDERTIRDGLKALLTGEGYSVRTARDGETALTKFGEKRPDLVLLDVMMPKMNGFVVCGEIRKLDSVVPVIMLTAKNGEGDQIRGMGLGADDYISKDVGEGLLLARIRRALERVGNSHASAALGDTLRLGRVTVDLGRFLIRDGAREEEMTAQESALLNLLLGRRGKVVTFEEILSEMRDRNGYAGELSVVRAHVKNLRRKLGRASDMIVSVYGRGYYLV